MNTLARTTIISILAVFAGIAACSCGAESVDAFLPSGRMALGANYWASHAATEMWRKWDAKVVDEDLRVLAANGFRILRVFPNWADFQPIHACYLSGGNFDKVYETRMFDSEEPLPDTPCGRAGVDERMVEHFEEFCDLAEKHGIRLIVPLLTGQMTFRNFIPPALANRDPFSDPYALMWEGRYLECMVTRLKAKKAIVAWESGNEANSLGKSENAFRSEAWLRYVHQAIRCADPSRPVIGVDGIPDYQLLIRLVQEIILIQIQLLAGTAAGFAIGQFADAADFAKCIRSIVAIDNIEFVAAFVGIHKLAGRSQFCLYQLKRNRIDDLFHSIPVLVRQLQK